MVREGIVVLDFGGQYNQLITRRIRDAGVYCEMLDFETDLATLSHPNVKGIIFSGGPNSVYEAGAPQVDPKLYDLGIPILGICYGMQMMAQMLGGEVSNSHKKEYGKVTLDLSAVSSPLVNNVSQSSTIWMSHVDQVSVLPQGFKILGSTKDTKIALFGNEDKKFYGIQFHPEVTHSDFGQQFLVNFLTEVCGASLNWSMDSFIESEIQSIRSAVGDKNVLCALSGGVDSAVAAVLMERAIGDQLTCMFVDHGLLRKGEREIVENIFKDKYNLNIITIDAKERFFSKLAGISEPEAKRKIIGEEFIRVFESESKKLKHIDFLVQGTLYTDIIESGTKTAQTIKSHHNVGGLPEDVDFKILEPLKWLFKDEVRKLGLELGMEESVVYRQPFPGPGLGIRILSDVTPEKVFILQEADAIVREEITNWDQDREVWQYFAVLPNIRSVGVMGDARTYSYTIIVRAVGSVDGMTASWSKLPHELLERISNRIVNEVDNVNRVAYDITSKPPGTIEWE